jgi:hypothetical protein
MLFYSGRNATFSTIIGVAADNNAPGNVRSVLVISSLENVGFCVVLIDWCLR